MKNVVLGGAIVWLLAAPAAPSGSAAGPGQAPGSVPEIVRRNVAAAGGEERLAAVRNLSFRSGENLYYLGADGAMKVVIQGLPPAVIAVILADRDGVRENQFGERIDPPAADRARYTLYAKLFGGCFTLRNLASALRFEGIRRFGAETFYRLSADIPPLTVEFDLDTTEGLLRQIALRGTNPDGSRSEEFFDLGPYRDYQGVRMPSSWFQSQVGGRGDLHEISEVGFNVPLDEDFFKTDAVNIGSVAVSPGSLSGCVLNFLDQGGSFVLVTNWTPAQAEQAGLKSGGKLALKVEDLESEAVYYARSSEIESADAYRPGARILSFDPERGNLLWILYFVPSAEETAAVKGKVKGLSPVAVRLR
jgi:hypothetical protein